MKAIDKIIGYSGIKRELRQIADTLKKRDAYEKLGVSSPRGLLLYGEPGVGKSLMASAIIEESGRTAFTCRKDKPNGDFVKHIKEIFDKAAENTPSIVYLDDMDKFANGDERRPDAEEYVTVQSCIDEVKGKEVFVLATVNNIRNLPKSLRRAGRFDRVVEVKAPYGKDAEEIIDHYLGNKKFVDGVDTKMIARIMNGRSCAELETVINEAGLYAGYERAESITMHHFMSACLRMIFDVDVDLNENGQDCSAALSDYNNIISHIVYHEAGHAIISEILSPESVTLICAYSQDGSDGGFTDYYNTQGTPPMLWKKSRIVASLGGMAALDQVYGISDWGNSDDLDRAFRDVRNMVVNNCGCGLHLHHTLYEDSQRVLSDQEQVISVEVEKYYKKAKEIISHNRDFLDKIAVALAKKRFLTMADIKEIKETCTITPISL